MDQLVLCGFALALLAETLLEIVGVKVAECHQLSCLKLLPRVSSTLVHSTLISKALTFCAAVRLNFFSLQSHLLGPPHERICLLSIEAVMSFFATNCTLAFIDPQAFFWPVPPTAHSDFLVHSSCFTAKSFKWRTVKEPAQQLKFHCYAYLIIFAQGFLVLQSLL